MSDSFVVVCADACNIFNLLEIVTYGLGKLLDASDNSRYSLVDTALEIHRIGTCGHILQTDTDNRLSKDGSGCCAVTCIIAGLRGNLLHELSAHILEGIFKLDFTGNTHTVFSDVRCAELFFDNNITAFRAKSYLNGIGKSVDTLFKLFACFDIEKNFFCHNFWILSIDNCQNIALAHDKIFIAVEFDFSACIFAVEDFVTFLKHHLFIFGTVAGCKNFAFKGFFLCGIRDNNTCHRYFLGGSRLD
ncbi:putative uncharacterized protein [Prevotella sp. CAG:1031]|nr:putative uncharacterized protein [Prevotella sp. CAG:1031]